MYTSRERNLLSVFVLCCIQSTKRSTSELSRKQALPCWIIKKNFSRSFGKDLPQTSGIDWGFPLAEHVLKSELQPSWLLLRQRKPLRSWNQLLFEPTDEKKGL
ncbi:hypothetical protein GHT09_011073 [Marmota monax]|uniref:Uncharacterized protein n=1 Tax=Marmota monax TaxID=9995 RepID=A0A834UZJ5_MARMO|nr:hypothetical protein GHT09_011073 [Marmota monax]